MKKQVHWLALPLCAVWLVGVTIYAQDPAPPPQDPQAQDAGGGRGGGRGAEPVIRPYERVITREAASKTGVFTVHRIKDRLFYEIPKAAARAASSSGSARSRAPRSAPATAASPPATASSAGIGAATACSCAACPTKSAPTAKPPIARAVRDANYDPIVMSFNIEALGKDDAPVIEVTRLFTTDVPEFSGRTRVRRAHLRRVAIVHRSRRAFPGEHRGRGDPDLQQPAGRRRGPRRRAGTGAGRRTRRNPGPSGQRQRRHALQHGAAAREADAGAPLRRTRRLLLDRQIDYGQDEHRSPERRFITRYRLEKKDPTAALSEPVKPITYWVDPATPTKWVPYVKKGIEDWQPAFEAAGFKNGIVAKEAPSPTEDPDWSPEDARYSVIRWLPSTIENACGPHIHDPRSGEILESDIQFYHNVMNLARDWYFVQVGPLDPRAKTLPLPDDSDGQADSIRRGARSRPHARLPAQHEGELDVSGGEDPRSPRSSRPTATRRP